jgi:hypothetical protein
MMAKIDRLVVTLALAIGLSYQAVADNYNSGGDQQSFTIDRIHTDSEMVRPLNLELSTLGLKSWEGAMPETLDSDYEVEKDWVSEPLKYTFMPRLGGFNANSGAQYLHDAVLTE